MYPLDPEVLLTVTNFLPFLLSLRILQSNDFPQRRCDRFNMDCLDPNFNSPSMYPQDPGEILVGTKPCQRYIQGGSKVIIANPQKEH